MTRKQVAQKTHGHVIELSLVDESLPSEFRLFKAGWNDSEKGSVLFDEKASHSVMAAADKWGVDLMIDLEHQALEASTPPETTARDARGWFRLELRNGDLWAVGVKWTDDGAARLLSKRQRYISPAFSYDPESLRVTAIINVALTAIPATHDAPALIAASAIGEGMDPKIVKEAIDVVEAGDANKALELLKGIIASAAGGDADASTEDAPPPEGDGGADEGTELAAVPPPEEEKKEEVAAASARLFRLTGRQTFVGALDEVEVWRQSHIKLEAREAEIAKERTALEYGKRKENAITLTKLGAETPATTGLAKGKLCKRLIDEPLNEQNDRVAALLASRGGKLTDELKPPANDDTTGLSARELKKLKEKGVDPEMYKKIKARMGGT